MHKSQDFQLLQYFLAAYGLIQVYKAILPPMMAKIKEYRNIFDMMPLIGAFYHTWSNSGISVMLEILYSYKLVH